MTDEDDDRPDDEPSWDINDLAAHLGRTPEAIMKMRQLGHLPPPTRVGNRAYWKRDELLKWLRDNGGGDDGGLAGVPAKT